MAENLNRLQWNRVDVNFSATALYFLAHNLIQVHLLTPRPFFLESQEADNLSLALNLSAQYITVRVRLLFVR